MSPLATVRNVARAFVTEMKAHSRHQNRWQRHDDGTIWCADCDMKIIGPDSRALAGARLLNTDDQAKVREIISRWLRTQADGAMIFPTKPTP